MTPIAQTNGRVRVLTHEEGCALFDRAARRYMNMSGDEFIRKYEAEEFGDPDKDPNVIRVAMLIPFTT